MLHLSGDSEEQSFLAACSRAEAPRAAAAHMRTDSRRVEPLLTACLSVPAYMPAFMCIFQLHLPLQFIALSKCVCLSR